MNETMKIYQIFILLNIVSVSFGLLVTPTATTDSNVPREATGGGRGDEGSRREFLDKVSKVQIAGAVAFGFLSTSSQNAWASAKINDDSRPFCIIGANGRTGTKCVQGCLERNIPVRATSRSGVYYDEEAVLSSSNSNKQLLSSVVCDVTNPATIGPAIEGTRAVIFAASASKGGGTPAQVDNEGLVNVASACLKAKVPHLVIVSSGGVSKPDSSVYKFLNLFNNIMEQKIVGEDTVRNMYHRNAQEGADATSEDNVGELLTYTIVRPGGLTEDPPLGVTSIELNQGDMKTGRISRTDVASVCIEATNYPQYTSEATLECYYANTGKTLNNVGMSNILKQTNDPNEFLTGNECRGKSWEEIFSGLKSDLSQKTN